MSARRGEGGANQVYAHPPGRLGEKCKIREMKEICQILNNKNKSKEKSSTLNTLGQPLITALYGFNISLKQKFLSSPLGKLAASLLPLETILMVPVCLIRTFRNVNLLQSSGVRGETIQFSSTH
jgi:hypothetical protein